MRIGGGAVSIADVTDREARDLGFVRKFWYNEIINGRAFTGVADLAASAGNNSHAQLINPAGSGVTVVVYLIVTSPGSALLFHIRTHNTELTTDTGAGTSLNAGATAAVAHIRSQNNASLLGTLVNSMVIPANGIDPVGPFWSWQLGAGEGIIVVPDSVNTGHRTNFFWAER